MSPPLIGTSGWSYPHWKGIFYPKDLAKRKYLEFYAKRFDTVELNASFYHLPQKSTFKNWYQRTPKDFVFAVKVSRFITHRKYLKDCKEPWQNFFQRARLLKEKLGPFLIQLPPRWTKNFERLKNFVQVIRKNSSFNSDKFTSPRFVFEFRNETWFDKEIFDFFKNQKNITLCQADSRKWPCTEEITGDFVYLRFHGAEQIYGSDYPKKQLEGWAWKIKSYLKQDLDLYCYFNNDFKGYAVKNAKILYNLLH